MRSRTDLFLYHQMKDFSFLIQIKTSYNGSQQASVHKCIIYLIKFHWTKWYCIAKYSLIDEKNFHLESRGVFDSSILLIKKHHYNWWIFWSILNRKFWWYFFFQRYRSLELWLITPIQLYNVALRLKTKSSFTCWFSIKSIT